MRAGVERHVAPAKRSQFRDAQAGLDGDEENRAVASPNPGCRVGDSKECLHFFMAQELDNPAREALARNREHALAMESVGGLGKRDITEESVHRCEAGVTTAGRVAAHTLEVIEKLSEEDRVEIRNDEAGRRTAEALTNEAQEQTEGRAIRGDGMRARLPLPLQAVREEPLQQRGEVGDSHDPSLRGCVARSVASWRSSGTASMYQ